MTIKNVTEGEKKAQKLNWISQCQLNQQLQQGEKGGGKNPKVSIEQVKK